MHTKIKYSFSFVILFEIKQKYAELTPNKTRRAQCANWLLFYREELFGFTVEELRERRQKKREAEEAEKLRLEKESGEKPEEKWKPPVKEVF